MYGGSKELRCSHRNKCHLRPCSRVSTGWWPVRRSRMVAMLPCCLMIWRSVRAANPRTLRVKDMIIPPMLSGELKAVSSWAKRGLFRKAATSHTRMYPAPRKMRTSEN
eukprot:3147309-Prymnesium_polylepis.1